jgi:hypothetical protein
MKWRSIQKQVPQYHAPHPSIAVIVFLAIQEPQ